MEVVCWWSRSVASVETRHALTSLPLGSLHCYNLGLLFTNAPRCSGLEQRVKAFFSPVTVSLYLYLPSLLPGFPATCVQEPIQKELFGRFYFSLVPHEQSLCLFRFPLMIMPFYQAY